MTVVIIDARIKNFRNIPPTSIDSNTNKLKIELGDLEICFNNNFSESWRAQIFIVSHTHSTSNHILDVERTAPMTVERQDVYNAFSLLWYVRVADSKRKDL